MLNSNSCFFYYSKRMTNISSSLDRQAWTITISTEKNKIKQFSCWPTPILSELPLSVTLFFSIAKHSLYKQNLNLNKSFSDAQICHMSPSVLLPVVSQLFHTRELSRLRQSFAVYSQKICISLRPSSPPPPCCVVIGQSRMNHRMVT